MGRCVFYSCLAIFRDNIAAEQGLPRLRMRVLFSAPTFVQNLQPVVKATADPNRSSS